MTLRPPRSTRTDTHSPYTTLFRAKPRADADAEGRQGHLRRRRGHRRSARGAGRDRRVPERPDQVRAARRQDPQGRAAGRLARSEEHTSELQSLMRISYAVFCLKKKNEHTTHRKIINNTHTIKSKRNITAYNDKITTH